MSHKTAEESNENGCVKHGTGLRPEYCPYCKIEQLEVSSEKCQEALVIASAALKRLADAAALKTAAQEAGVSSVYLRAVREINDAIEECVAIGKEL